MLYGTAEFRKNFYIKLRQMTGIIFRAPGRIDATRVHARASAKRATGSGVRFSPKADIRISAKRLDELPKLDRFLRAGAVPVISVSFALRRATASAVHPADLPTSHRRCTTRLARPF